MANTTTRYSAAGTTRADRMTFHILERGKVVSSIMEGVISKPMNFKENAAIAKKIPQSKIISVDISGAALQICRKNVNLNKLNSRVICMQADAKQAPPRGMGSYDMIVCNPPYIPSEEIGTLDHSVKDFEPVLALHGGDDGLEFYRAIAKNYADALKPGGYLAFEFGMGQGDGVCTILEQNGYTILERSRDYNDRERAVLAQYGRKEA